MEMGTTLIRKVSEYFQWPMVSWFRLPYHGGTLCIHKTSHPALSYLLYHFHPDFIENKVNVHTPVISSTINIFTPTVLRHLYHRHSVKKQASGFPGTYTPSTPPKGEETRDPSLTEAASHELVLASTKVMILHALVDIYAGGGGHSLPPRVF